MEEGEATNRIRHTTTACLFFGCQDRQEKAKRGLSPGSCTTPCCCALTSRHRVFEKFGERHMSMLKRNTPDEGAQDRSLMLRAAMQGNLLARLRSAVLCQD